MKAHTGLLLATVACALAAAAFAQETPSAPPTQPRPRRSPPTAQQPAPASTEPEAAPAAQQVEQEQQRPAREAARERERREESQPSEERGERGSATHTAFHFDMKETAPSVTRHQVEVNGRTLRYTATAGRLPIRNGEGTTEALMFYVAYTLDGADVSRRPLTFAYNGGPGSASIWLHMGALGPRTVALDAQGFMPQPPFRLHDNPYTPLDRTDLVLVDAIGTGWSRPADAAAARKYENPEGDIQAFGEFIRLYLTRHERWSSPLYLFGESYGTTRSAGIAGYLQGRGIVFNGIGLLSMALNFQTLSFSAANDAAYPWNVPTYMAIAYYHHRLAPELQQAIDLCQKDPNAACAPLREAEEWAITDYAATLARGDSRSALERQRVIDRLSRYTGLPKAIVDEFNLRIDVGTFCHYLLLDQRLRVGRLDGRYALPEPDVPGGRGPGSFTDPSSTQTVGPFTMTFNQYVRTELNYRTDLPYYTFARDSGMFLWSAAAGRPPVPAAHAASRRRSRRCARRSWATPT